MIAHEVISEEMIITTDEKFTKQDIEKEFPGWEVDEEDRVSKFVYWRLSK
jgi:hypothetical protein